MCVVASGPGTHVFEFFAIMIEIYELIHLLIITSLHAVWSESIANVITVHCWVKFSADSTLSNSIELVARYVVAGDFAS